MLLYLLEGIKCSRPACSALSCYVAGMAGLSGGGGAPSAVLHVLPVAPPVLSVLLCYLELRGIRGAGVFADWPVLAWLGLGQPIQSGRGRRAFLQEKMVARPVEQV